MRVAGSVSAHLRDVRVTLRAVKRDVRWVREDVNDMTRKLDVATAHLETVHRKMDRLLTFEIQSFLMVMMLIGFMVYLLNNILWLDFKRTLAVLVK
jgi:hypothetical protein